MFGLQICDCFPCNFDISHTFFLQTELLGRKSRQSTAVDLPAPCLAAWLLNTSAAWFVWLLALIGWFLVSLLAHLFACFCLCLLVWMPALRYCLLPGFLSCFCAFLCSVFPSCFVTICAEAEKVPFGSGKNTFWKREICRKREKYVSAWENSLFETEKIHSDVRKIPFAEAKKNPRGNEKNNPENEKKYRTRKKIPGRSGKSPGNGKNTIPKREKSAARTGLYRQRH